MLRERRPPPNPSGKRKERQAKAIAARNAGSNPARGGIPIGSGKKRRPVGKREADYVW